MLNKKHNLKSRKTEIRKRDLKGKARQETINKKRLMKKINWSFKIFIVFFSENKSNKERKMKKKTKIRIKKKAKRKTIRKKIKTRARERQRKRNRKRGRQKKA